MLHVYPILAKCVSFRSMRQSGLEKGLGPRGSLWLKIATAKSNWILKYTVDKVGVNEFVYIYIRVCRVSIVFVESRCEHGKRGSGIYEHGFYLLIRHLWIWVSFVGHWYAYGYTFGETLWPDGIAFNSKLACPVWGGTLVAITDVQLGSKF
jgi:hypothetical protein